MRFKIPRLLFDFGLVVLIWLVQLVIYPSFRNFDAENLLAWHAIYVRRITFIVLPLMLGQLTIALIQFSRNRSSYSSGSLLMILFVWILTFTIFVPLHTQIESGNFDFQTLEELVAKNWFRTILWSAIFLWTLFQNREQNTASKIGIPK